MARYTVAALAALNLVAAVAITMAPWSWGS
jgi:hypothetical protein